MKKSIILSAIAISGFIYNTANAQIGVQVGFHFGHPRVYAPAPVVEQAPVYDQNYDGYNNDNDYYYLPDVDAYYNIDEQCYYYFDGDNWISAAYLPGEYRGFDWRNARHFEVRASRPYMHNEFYRNKFNGHIADWGHRGYDNHFNAGYANADRFDRGHVEDQHLNDRGRDGFNQRFDNRMPERPMQRPDNDRQHFDNRGQGGFNQPAPMREQHNNGQQLDNRGQGGNMQPAQPGREQHNGGQQNENHGNGGNAQPSNQNENRGQLRGGNDHFAQNTQHGGSFNERMRRF